MHTIVKKALNKKNTMKTLWPLIIRDNFEESVHFEQIIFLVGIYGGKTDMLNMLSFS
jgi:hypothetical protein